MNIGIILYNLKIDVVHWPNKQLITSIKKLGHTCRIIEIDKLSAILGSDSNGVWYNNLNLSKDLSIALIRNFGRGSCDAYTFRISALEHLELDGVLVVNSVYPTRRAKDKYATLALLEKHNLPVPYTVVTSDSEFALDKFSAMKDVVVKPLIGARGLGSIRVDDYDMAYRAYKTITNLGQVIYAQQFIKKPNRDIRVFVIGDTIIGAIYRYAPPELWKSNVAQGAKVEPMKPSENLQEIALKAVKLLELEYAGVDIIEGSDGCFILEVNPIPSWRGLQSVYNINVADLIIKHVIKILKR